MAIKPIRFENDTLLLLDQRLLPNEEVWLSYKDAEGVAEAIRSMVVRGAPAIGVTAAYGAALGADAIYAGDFIEFFEEFTDVCDLLAATRPTAVNLCWALERMKDLRPRPCGFAGERAQGGALRRSAGDCRRG